jgi:hypothetical protein
MNKCEAKARSLTEDTITLIILLRSRKKVKSRDTTPVDNNKNNPHPLIVVWRSDRMLRFLGLFKQEEESERFVNVFNTTLSKCFLCIPDWTDTINRENIYDISFVLIFQCYYKKYNIKRISKEFWNELMRPTCLTFIFTWKCYIFRIYPSETY